MEKQTFILTAMPNGFDAAGRARLSVIVSPRLWWQVGVPPALDLSHYPDLVHWPERLGEIAWSATIDAGAPVALDVETDWLKPQLWEALFTGATRVEPYAFDDYRGMPILSLEVTTIVDMLADLYGRGSTYGAGSDRPTLDIWATDPDLVAVARPSFPEPEPNWVTPGTAAVPFPDAPPTIEKPEFVPEQPAPDDNMPLKGCAPGCLAFPLMILWWLLTLLGFKLKPWAKGGTAPVAPGPPSSEPADTPSFSTEVPPPPPPAPPPPPKSFLPPPPAPGVQQARHDAFRALEAFVASSLQADVELPDGADLADSWDFHQAISALGDFPVMLRRLGLVVDLLLPAGLAPPAAGTIKVEVDGPAWSAGTKIVSPRTHFRTSAKRFTAAPRPIDPDIVDGFLSIDDPARFSIVQNEAAGDALKVGNMATHAFRFAAAQDRAFGMPDDGGLPALRTTGLSLARREAAAELSSQFVRSCAINRFVASQDGSPETDPAGEGPAGQPAPTDELFAEDLVRGYRIDVLDKKTGIWRSLCEREGHYEFPDVLDAAGNPVFEDASDEGFVELAVTEETDPAVPKGLRMTESLFTWSGWSLAAPRPGLVIMPDDSHDNPANEAVTPFKIEASFEARPGSLPRLRFGRRYKLRARVADLAGNSVTEPGRPDFADDGPAATAEVTARRYEPVAPPILMMREAPVEGESLERLVVRTPASGGPGARALTARHVAPPKTSQLMAELHGALDGAGFDGSATSYALSSRESKSVSDDALQTRPALDGLPGVPGAADSDAWIQPAAFVTVAYLPDPQAKGVVLKGLPASTGPDETDTIAFAGSWPDLKPFRIELKAVDGTTPPSPPSGPTGGVLTVELAPAQRATVRINCSMDAGDLDTRGVWEWTERQAPSNLVEVKANIVAGRHWAHLPWRELILVHAVQKPLADPGITIAAAKELGASFVTLSGSGTADHASTARLQLRARWTDLIDDPAAPAPAAVQSSSDIGEISVPEEAVPIPFGDLIHELRDTHYHSVDYEPVAVTRFREYFPASTNTPDATTRPGPKTPVEILNSARPAPPIFLYSVPLFEWDSPPGTPGITERTRSGGGLRLYLDRPWYSSGDGELLGVLFLEGMPFPGPEDPAAKIATIWAADPIRRGAVPPSTATAAVSFPANVATAANLSLPEQAMLVSVAGHEVRFDPDRRLWRADIRIECGEAYWPFVRLALARFQPNSVEHAHLSAVQLTSFIQLPPTRHAKVDILEPFVSVKVDGPIHADSEAISSFVTRSTSSNGLNEIELVLEELVAGADPADPLSWTALQTELIVPDPLAPGNWQGLWEGKVTLPGPLAASIYRLAIREYEWQRADDADPGDDAQKNRQFSRRMVYSDVFAL